MLTHAAVTTTAVSVVCPKCGIAKKSGKISCCGRGGSWFDQCGGAGDTKVGHTWHEGLQACKARAQSSIVIGQQLNGAHQANNDSSGGAGDVSSNADKQTMTCICHFVFSVHRDQFLTDSDTRGLDPRLITVSAHLQASYCHTSR